MKKIQAFCAAAMIILLLHIPQMKAQLIRDYTKRPLKELRLGYTFFYYYSQGSLDKGYFFEKIVGDTVIQGKHYAKIYSDPWKIAVTLKDRLPRNNVVPIDTFRFERSTDSAVYEWLPKQNTEILRLRSLPTYKSGDSIFLKTPIFNCTSNCNIAINALPRAFENNEPIIWQVTMAIQGNPYVTVYSRIFGLLSTGNNADSQFRTEFILMGSVFNNNDIHPLGGGTINLIQQLDTLLQTSRIAVGVREQEAAHSLSLAPNPVSDIATLRFILPTAQGVTIEICDMLGREVSPPLRFDALSSGMNALPIDVAGMARGVYAVRLRTALGLRATTMMVKELGLSQK